MSFTTVDIGCFVVLAMTIIYEGIYVYRFYKANNI